MFTWPLWWRIFVCPFFCHIMVICVIVQWSIKFWSNKIHIEGIPKWAKWISFFGITTPFLSPHRITKSWENVTKINNFNKTENYHQHLIVTLENLPILLSGGQRVGAILIINFSIVMTGWNCKSGSTWK